MNLFKTLLCNGTYDQHNNRNKDGKQHNIGGRSNSKSSIQPPKKVPLRIRLKPPTPSSESLNNEES